MATITTKPSTDGWMLLLVCNFGAAPPSKTLSNFGLVIYCTRVLVNQNRSASVAIDTDKQSSDTLDWLETDKINEVVSADKITFFCWLVGLLLCVCLFVSMRRDSALSGWCGSAEGV